MSSSRLGPEADADVALADEAAADHGAGVVPGPGGDLIIDSITIIVNYR